MQTDPPFLNTARFDKIIADKDENVVDSGKDLFNNLAGLLPSFTHRLLSLSLAICGRRAMMPLKKASVCVNGGRRRAPASI